MLPSQASASNTEKAEITVIEGAHQLLDESQASRTSPPAKPFRILNIGYGDGNSSGNDQQTPRCQD